MIRLLFTSGRGPQECRIALAKALAVFAREAEATGLHVDLATGRDPDALGPASAIACVAGDGAAAFAAGWVGSILWVARSPVRPHHKRKNWFVGVLRLEEPPPAAPKGTPGAVEIDARDVRFEALRAGGPGGQHQNKTESAIRAVHLPTGTAVVVRDGRSQHRNKALALARLAAHLALASELATIVDSQAIQAAHYRLQRGRPVRTFEGEAFRPR
jgi:peptide chain release factor